VSPVLDFLLVFVAVAAFLRLFTRVGFSCERLPALVTERVRAIATCGFSSTHSSAYSNEGPAGIGGAVEVGEKSPDDNLLETVMTSHDGSFRFVIESFSHEFLRMLLTDAVGCFQTGGGGRDVGVDGDAGDDGVGVFPWSLGSISSASNVGDSCCSRGGGTESREGAVLYRCTGLGRLKRADMCGRFSAEVFPNSGSSYTGDDSRGDGSVARLVRRVAGTSIACNIESTSIRAGPLDTHTCNFDPGGGHIPPADACRRVNKLSERFGNTATLLNSILYRSISASGM
jgi:hypothetical protein